MSGAGSAATGQAEAAALADRHDALLVDLDGTLILAGHPIPDAAASLKAAAARGARTVIVTNNASRSPAEVAESLSDMGFALTAADVVSSPQAAAAMLAVTHPRGSRVLVVGTQALCDAIADVGLVPVRAANDDPVAVVQGHSPDTGWRNLAEACVAIRGGADWVATNADTTLPTDRGLLPGNGSMVAALVAATGLHPRVAGKPARPLLDAASQRAGATTPLVVGDRLDTDIAAAVAAEMPSLFVLTGVSTPRDLVAADPDRRPTWVSADLRGLLDVRLTAPLDGTAVPGWSATERDGTVAGHLDGRTVGRLRSGGGAGGRGRRSLAHRNHQDHRGRPGGDVRGGIVRPELLTGFVGEPFRSCTGFAGEQARRCRRRPDVRRPGSGSTTVTSGRVRKQRTRPQANTPGRRPVCAREERGMSEVPARPAATPTDRLAAVDAELAGLDDVSLGEQLTAFERMHSALTTALSATVDQPGGGDAVAPGQPSLPYEDR